LGPRLQLGCQITAGLVKASPAVLICHATAHIDEHSPGGKVSIAANMLDEIIYLPNTKVCGLTSV
jgi:hypothetical protein